MKCFKVRKNLHRADVILSCAIISDVNIIKLNLLSTDKRPRRFEIHRVREYLVNFTCLVGIVKATVYKTEPIVTGLGHGKLSHFLTLL